MENVHFESCPSTQEYLLDNLGKFPCGGGRLIVTAADQTGGRGRRGRAWGFAEGNMAASFTLRASEKPSLTAIEVGVLVGAFFRDRFGKEILLKWPNDLVYGGLKCGGIVMKLVGDTVVCGLGLNLRAPPEGVGGAGSIFGSNAPDARTTALDIYGYILEARIGCDEVVGRFHRMCAHLGVHVVLCDGDERYQGIFRGIDADGGAIVGDGKIFYSGSLREM